MFEFLLRTSIRTLEAENLQKNKHIQPQPNFRCSNKKKRVFRIKMKMIFLNPELQKPLKERYNITLKYSYFVINIIHEITQ